MANRGSETLIAGELGQRPNVKDLKRPKREYILNRFASSPLRALRVLRGNPIPSFAV